MSFHGLIAHFFLALNNIPLSGGTTVYLSIHLLQGLLVASTFWQLGIKPWRLPVSGSTCKKLGSCHSKPTTSKKLNRVQNQQFFLDPLERGGRRANCCPQDWRVRLIQEVVAYWSRDSQWTMRHGSENLNCNWQTVGSSEVKNSGGTLSWGGSHNMLSYISRNLTRFPQ